MEDAAVTEGAMVEVDGSAGEEIRGRGARKSEKTFLGSST